MPTAGNAQVAKLIESIADMLEIKGESIFRIRAYRDAARAIETLPEDIEDVEKRGALTEIPGVGESIAAKISEFIETGHSTYYDELRKQVSPGLASLLEVSGIGPKKARLFHDKLGIDSVEKLEQAARDHRISTLPGMGPKTEQNILDSIERLRGRSERTPLGIALPSALPILKMVRDFEESERADLAGSLRRMRDTIGDLDLLVSSTSPEKVIDRFVELPIVKTVLGHGPTKGTIAARDNLQVDLRVVKPEEYGAALVYFTGSKEHNIKLRGIAEPMGLKLNEYGVFRVSDNKRVAGETEESVYEILNLRLMPPEIREDRGEIEASREGRLPNLVSRSDLKGDLHVHTDWSDGANTPEEMVEAAKQLGYEYLVISDHSVSMGFINGLTPERVREQRVLIDDLNRSHSGIRVLHGIELNIRADGTLDYEDDILEEFDIVTASIHTGMGMSREKMTQRIVDAISSPHVDVLGHPTGRLIGRRDPYEVDLDAVFRAAAETNTAMEINCQPDRLDLKDTDARLAKRYGVKVAINSDAHSVSQLESIDFGVATARRGWSEPENVLNALSLDELLRWLENKKAKVRKRMV